DLDGAVGKLFVDEFGELPDPVVLRTRPDVEGDVVDELAPRIQGAQDRSADVADVNDWSPGASVREEPDRSRGEGPAGQIVQDDVEPQTRRHAVGGGIPQRDRRERVVRQ